MIVAFCGHSSYVRNLNDEKKVMEILGNRVKNSPVEFFLGEYGGFDSFAYACAKKFKNKHPDSKLIFITPYLPKQKNHANEGFDLIIYPELEKIPPRYAIAEESRTHMPCDEQFSRLSPNLALQDWHLASTRFD